MSDLTSINGIGPATATKLTDLGIKTLDDLARQDNPADLAELVGGRGLTAEIVSGWIRDAGGQPPANTPPAAPPEPSPQTSPDQGRVAVRINRDFWDQSGERFRKGMIIEVPIETAFDGIESGALSRVK